jgi:DNA mismatch repair protein MutS
MDSATPMLRQYLEIKKLYPGTILFFRLGDFYEMFNEDALIGSRELEITLTARQKDSANPIPMCGVPYHAAANYIARLVKKGYRVAICDQTETPTKGTKLVKREVVRVITPGTAIDPQLVSANEAVYLAAISGASETFAAAFLDISTGDFSATEITGRDAWSKLQMQIESFSPKELLYSKTLRSFVGQAFGTSATLPAFGLSGDRRTVQTGSGLMTLTELDDWYFSSEECVRMLNEQFGARCRDARESRNSGIERRFGQTLATESDRPNNYRYGLPPSSLVADSAVNKADRDSNAPIGGSGAHRYNPPRSD